MKRVIDAVYENGSFRPMQPSSIGVPEGQHVRLTIEDTPEPKSLTLATSVYDGLSEQDIDEIEQIALERSNFFGAGSAD